MNIQIFGTKKCKNTQKAIRFFKERQIQVHFVDLNEKKMSKGELNSVLRSVSIDDLIDKEGKAYHKSNLSYMAIEPEEAILENPLILRTPIVRNSGRATAGYDPDIWKNWL